MSTLRLPRPAVSSGTLAVALIFLVSGGAFAQTPGGIIRDVSTSSEKLDLFVNTSKLLRLQKPIPRAMVQNPEVAELYPRGENQIQIVGKRAGFTVVTLWDNENRMYSLDVLVTADGRELYTHLQRQFPRATLKVTPLNNKVVLEGSVDDAAHVNQIVAIAQDFYPEVVNRITVGGVQQVLLHVKVMEVSRTKLRALGIDWSLITDGHFAIQRAAGGLGGGAEAAVAVNPLNTFVFGITEGSSSFLGAIEALRQNNLAKVLAEPNLVTVSGRPAFFNAGGEFPVLVPQSLGTISVEYKKFGTQVDFVPIVLSNGNIRLEVRPRVSEIDPTRSVTLANTTIPGLRVREADTGVELRAGQTLAIAGLVQTRVESETKGLPWLMELPHIGTLFRRVEHQENEIELLILVTPELVHGMERHEVPCGGPGLHTMSPDDHELYHKAYLEVPRCCGPCHGPEAVGPGVPMEYGVPGATEVIPTPQTGPTPPAGPPAGPGAPTPPSARRQPKPRSALTAGQRSPQRASQSNRYGRPNPRQPNASPPRQQDSPAPGFLGPIGYDVKK